MLTSFFRKSRPINFLLVFLPTIIFYVAYNFSGSNSGKGWGFLLEKTLVLFFFLLTLLISNYIILKDKSGARHTYVLLLLLLFSLSSPAIMTTDTIIMAGFFTAMGMHRTIGMQNGKNIGKKTFESFFYFAIAGLIFPTTLIFMVLPLWNILYYASGDYKNWLIPIPAVLSVLILKTSYSLVVRNTFFNPFSLSPFRLTELDIFNKAGILWPLGIISLFTAWGLINSLMGRGLTSQIEKRGKYFLLFSLGVGIGAVLLSGNFQQKPGASLLFFYLPAALIGGRYLESKKDSRLKGILLLVLLIICPLFGIIYRWF